MRARILILSNLIFIILLSFSFTKQTESYPFPDLPYFPEMPSSVDNPVTKEGALLGRYLFYDSILSLDYRFSCASCHHQKHAFADASNRFSKGIEGDIMKRNTMPLFNLAWYDALFWDGRAGSLEDQVFEPVRAHDEMSLSWEEAESRVGKSAFYRKMFYDAFRNQSIDSVLIAKAIAQFERTLLSYNSKYDKVLRREEYFSPLEYEGFVLANDQSKGDCMHCHTTDGDALGTTGGFSNNGLDMALSPDAYLDLGLGGISGREEDNGKFKIPSLRNVLLTAPYMHDGRFETLEEVVEFYNSGVHNSVNVDSKMFSARSGGLKLTLKEQEAIVAFLKTLTDTTFITNEEFGNPFIN